MIRQSCFKNISNLRLTKLYSKITRNLITTNEKPPPAAAASKLYNPTKTFVSPAHRVQSKVVKSESGIGKGVDLFETIDKQTQVIKGYTDNSFLINNVLVNQSVILFPQTMLLWDARDYDDITIESLSVFATIYPTIEILFIGCGEVMTKRFPKQIYDHYRDRGIVIEACDTKNAAATFNVLVSEGRNVGAALLTIQPNSDEDRFKRDFMQS